MNLFQPSISHAKLVALLLLPVTCSAACGGSIRSNGEGTSSGGSDGTKGGGDGAQAGSMPPASELPPPIPNDPSLLGTPAYIDAVHCGSGVLDREALARACAEREGETGDCARALAAGNATWDVWCASDATYIDVMFAQMRLGPAFTSFCPEKGLMKFIDVVGVGVSSESSAVWQGSLMPNDRIPLNDRIDVGFMAHGTVPPSPRGSAMVQVYVRSRATYCADVPLTPIASVPVAWSTL